MSEKKWVLTEEGKRILREAEEIRKVIEEDIKKDMFLSALSEYCGDVKKNE